MKLVQRLMVWIPLALILVVGSACTSMDRAESISEMNKGLEALNGGQTLEAVKLLKEAARIDSTYADPPYFLGQIYHRKLNETDNAETFYRDAFSRDGENPQIAYQLGALLQETGKDQDAMQFLKTATDLKPDFAKAWFRYGLSLENQEMYTEAIDAYMKSIQANARMKMDSDSKGGEAYHALGDLYNRYGFYDHAVKVYENGMENNPDVARLHLGLGVAQLQLKRYPDSETNFKRALELDASLTTAVFNLAVAQMAQGKTQEAMSGFDMFAQRADQSKDAARIIAAQGFIMQMREEQEKE